MSTSNQHILASLLRAREKKKNPESKPLKRAPGMTPEEKKQWEEDKAFYAEIWAASPHICQCGCNTKLGREPLTLYFHHLLPKAKYPQFRHTTENIMILAQDCHAAVESCIDNRPVVRKRRDEAIKLLLNK